MKIENINTLLFFLHNENQLKKLNIR